MTRLLLILYRIVILVHLGNVLLVHVHVCIIFAVVIDLEDTESLFREFDSVIFERATAENLFGLLDASSLLWRLNTMGVEVGEERWKRVTDALATHVNNHRSPWSVYMSS